MIDNIKQEKQQYDNRLQEILNYFNNIPANKRRDYRWLRNNLSIFENNRDFVEAKNLIIKLLEIENKERLKFIKNK